MAATVEMAATAAALEAVTAAELADATQALGELFLSNQAS